MKAISLTLPWPLLIRDGRKDIETRSWKTNYRGRLAIHGTKTINRQACLEFGYPQIDAMYRGAIICIVDLMDCVQFPHPACIPDAYGDFTPGRWGWILANVQTLVHPVPAVGHQGLWNWKPPTRS